VTSVPGQDGTYPERASGDRWCLTSRPQPGLNKTVVDCRRWSWKEALFGKMELLCRFALRRGRKIEEIKCPICISDGARERTFKCVVRLALEF
jgi:hypothetical protein